MDDVDSPNRIFAYLKSHNAIRTGVYQLTSLPLIISGILTQDINGGACNPGPALVIMLLGVLINVLLVAVSLALRFARGKQYLPPVLINLVALTLIISVSLLRSVF